MSMSSLLCPFLKGAARSSIQLNTNGIASTMKGCPFMRTMSSTYNYNHFSYFI